MQGDCYHCPLGAADKMTYHSPFFFVVSAMIASLAFTQSTLPMKPCPAELRCKQGLYKNCLVLKESATDPSEQ